MIVMGAGPDEPVGGRVMVSGDVVGVVSVGGGVVVVSGGSVVVVVVGGVFVIWNRHGPLMFSQMTYLLAIPTGNVTSTVLPGNPVSVTLSRLLSVTRRPPCGTPGAVVSM